MNETMEYSAVNSGASQVEEPAEPMLAALESALAEVRAHFSPKRAKENAAFSCSGRTE